MDNNILKDFSGHGFAVDLKPALGDFRPHSVDFADSNVRSVQHSFANEESSFISAVFCLRKADFDLVPYSFFLQLKLTVWNSHKPRIGARPKNKGHCKTRQQKSGRLPTALA